MNGVAVSVKKNIHFVLKLIFIEIKITIYYERGCHKCEKYYTILVHNLKTSKTGVFDVIKEVNSPPQARKKSVFPFFDIQLKGIPPPLVGGWVWRGYGI